MTDTAELEVRRRLQAAMDSKDAKAELKARRELSSLMGPKSGIGGGTSEQVAFKHSGIETSEGSPFFERVGLSIKKTPQGKKSYLEAKYGSGNVSTLPTGGFVVREPGKDWRVVDEPGFTVGDIADIAGPTIEAAPAVLAGISLTPLGPEVSVPGVAGAAASGNILRQSLSGMLPGSDEMGIGQRVADVAISYGLGAAGQYGAEKIGRGIEAVRPHNVIARTVQKSMLNPYARQGARLERSLGIRFSPGQKTGAKSQLTLEGLARRHPVSADKVQAFDEQQVNTAYKFIRGLQSKASPKGGGPVTTGAEVSKGFHMNLDSALSARSFQWAKDFKPVISAAGDHKIMPLNSTRNAIRGIIDDFDVPGGGDATASLVTRLKGMLGELDKPLSAKQTQRLLQIYGKAVRGQGQLFKDIDKGQQREVGRRVFSALQKDLDDFAEGGVQGNKIVSALRTARANWKQNSQAIDDLENSVLGRLFGGKYDPAPEAIADKFLRMRGTEISEAARILDQSNPDAMNMIRSHMIEVALRKAAPAATAEQVAFSPAKFNSFLRSHSEQFMSAFLSGKKNAQLGQLKQAYEALNRLAYRAGTEGSPTAPLLLAWDMAKSAFTFNPVGLARNTAAIVAPRRIAELMSTESGRQALITITKTKPGTKAAINAAAVITSVLSRESSADNTSEDGNTQGYEEGGDQVVGP